MDIRSWARDEPGYPKKLLALPDSPERVYLRGILPEGGAVGIVGSRAATEAGRRVARSLAASLAEAGAVVVSGGALGIDGAAHQGALDAGGKTLVVLPSPVSAPVPHSNHPIFDAILRTGGGFLSEADKPHSRHFALRNRLIAALSDVIVLVEAGARSGTRHTLAAAKLLQRPIGACPWPFGDERLPASLAIYREGGFVVGEAQDVLKCLTLTAPAPSRAGDPILAMLGLGPLTAEGLAHNLGQPIQQILARLSHLELEGRVRDQGGIFVRR